MKTKVNLRKMEKRLQELDKGMDKAFTYERFVEWTKERGVLVKKLEPYRCPMCFKIVYDDEDYVVEYGKRWHPECRKKLKKL